MKRPDLAATLYRIAEEGPETLHNGSLTKSLVEDIRAFGGIITEDDLRNYTPKWEKPITVNLTGDTVLYTTPLPGSGSILAFILNTLVGFVGGTDAPFGSPLAWHRIIETFKYAYSWRTMLGDPRRTDLNGTLAIKELEARLADPTLAAVHRQLVNDSAAPDDWRHYGALYAGAEDRGTAHVVVVAPAGDAVSVTSTINYTFGSKRISPSTGITLNNQMDDFAIPGRISSYGVPPSPANLLQAGMQPLSSMVPSVVLDRDRRPRLVVGAAGGTKITTQVALVILGTVVEGASFPSVMTRPRLHHQLIPMQVEYQEDFDQAIITALQDKGHKTAKVSAEEGFAAVVGAGRDDGGFYLPQTDRLRPGSVDGF